MLLPHTRLAFSVGSLAFPGFPNPVALGGPADGPLWVGYW